MRLRELSLTNGPLIFGLSCLDTPTNDGRFGSRQLLFDWEVEIDAGSRMETAQPGLVGNGLRATMRDLVRCAAMSKVDYHIALKIRNDLVGCLGGRITLIDPQDGFPRSGHDFALPDLATAAQQPDVIGTLAPATGLICRNADGCLNIRQRRFDFPAGHSRDQKDNNGDQPSRTDTTDARPGWRTQTTASSIDIATSVQNGGILAQGPLRRIRERPAAAQWKSTSR